MSKPTLVMPGPMMAMIMRQLDDAFNVVRLWEAEDRDAAIAAVAAKVEAIATAGHMPITSELMDKLPQLRIVANMGVGYDTIDAQAADARGIIVTNTPDVLSDEVADTTIGLLLMTIRELSRAERYLREGRWVGEGHYPLTKASLQNRTVGIIGLGRIGKAIAQRLEGFGRAIHYHGRRAQADVSYTYHGDLIAMADTVDTLIAITPGGEGTRHLVNADVLRALGSNGIFINVARGSVVDQDALITALQDGTIYAAGLDVFADEPNVPEALLALDNVVVLPHVASASVHTRDLMGQLVVDNLLALKADKAPISPVVETPFKGWKG
ncbi:MAG: 2-hydroxyacid dehydrogenase [Pseudomonadota bacterium]